MEWIRKKLTEPQEIINFINCVFEVYEIRGRIGKTKGISFIVHSNEQNHSVPHIHAKYGEYEVSISILTGEVLAGNLPKKNIKIAIEWVIRNKSKLLSDWNNYVLSANSTLTSSLIGVKL